MRIKYKIWDTEEKAWVENIFVSACGHVVVGSNLDECRYVPCIYTGLIDNSGNMIYCGDILAYPNGDFTRGDGGNDDRMEVYYDNSQARFELRFFSKYGGEGHTSSCDSISEHIAVCGATVIGNVNSTPQLLTL